MATTGTGTFELLALELARALGPLADRLRDPHHARMLLVELGLVIPETSVSPALATALQTVSTSAHALVDEADELKTAIDGGDTAAIIVKGASLARTIATLVEAFDTIANQVAALGSVPGVSAADLAAFVAALPDRLFQTVLVEYFEGYHRLAHALLEFLGIIEKTRLNVGSSDPGRPEVVQKRFRFDRIGQFLQSPDQIFTDIYHWGQPGFDGNLLVSRISSFLRAAHVPVTHYRLPGSPVRDAIEVCVLRIAPTTGVTPPGLEATVTAAIGDGVSIDLPFAPGWRAHLAAEGALDASVGIRVQPPADVTVIPPSGSLQGRLRAGIAHVPVSPSSAIVLLGVTGGTGLSVERIELGLVGGFRWDSATSRALGDIGFEGELHGGKLRISMEGADGFLGELLADIAVEADFNLGMGWTASQGVYFTGSSTLEIQLPVHVSLGPVELSALTLRVGIDGQRFPIALATDIKASLGPLQIVVEQIGASVDLSFPADGRGDIGPVDIAFRFLPPRGVGLVVDAGAVKGGGYLFLDPDREEYAGALELVFSDWIALKAIGLITTRLPDGSKGFSLIIIITVEFGTGIQLGFGFTLLGVGGLLGLHRIVKIEPLAEGVRTGAIESVMFPEDVIANAPRIISDLRKFFPPQRDIFLVGPMAKIGWGTPTLVRVQLGVILEFPSVNITILGVMKVVLPDEDADVLRLQVNFIGRIEPSNKLLWFYAELFDSRVLSITLEGGFGLLVNWGSNANFVVSVGGFHPRYNPPPLPFREPPRLAVSLLNESYAKIRIDGYFAVTSNSVQFGARVELFFGLSEFSIEGHLAFDALFLFDPFFFSFGLSISLSVKVFGMGLFSVGFSGLLEGPTPWFIKGKGKIGFLFFSISVPFEHTWGRSQDTMLDPITVYPLLEAEFNALTNWQAEVPDNSQLLVSLRKLGETDSDQLVLHPVGRLLISQRKVPLKFHLDKVGNQKPSDYDKLVVDATLNGDGLLSVSKVEEQFAIGQFKDLDGSDRLSAPGFEPLESGIAIGMPGEQMKTSRGVRRVIRYETIIIDSNFKRHVKTFFSFFVTGYAALNDFLFTHFLVGNSATQSVLSKHQRERMQPFNEVITVQPHQYSVVFNTDNRPVDFTATTFSSQAMALQYMEEQISEDDGLAEQLHVVPNTEVHIGA